MALGRWRRDDRLHTGVRSVAGASWSGERLPALNALALEFLRAQMVDDRLHDPEAKM